MTKVGKVGCELRAKVLLSWAMILLVGIRSESVEELVKVVGSVLVAAEAARVVVVVVTALIVVRST